MSDAAKFAQECVTDGGRTGALTLFSEDQTWNKCGKLEVVKVEKSKEGNDVINANAWIGMTPGSKLPGVNPAILDPRDTYADASEWETKAKDLSARFVKNFAKYEGNEAGKALVAAGPQL